MSDDERRKPDGTMKKGFSANPKGRPRKSRNLLTIFNEKRDEQVWLDDPVTKKRVRMSRAEAWVVNLWNRAIQLDFKASAQVLMLMRASGQLAPAGEGEPTLDTDGEAVLDALISRMARAKLGDDDS